MCTWLSRLVQRCVCAHGASDKRKKLSCLAFGPLYSNVFPIECTQAGVSEMQIEIGKGVGKLKARVRWTSGSLTGDRFAGAFRAANIRSRVSAKANAE